MVRDTEEDWKMLGDTEPWYGVLSAPEYLKQNINDEAKEKFYAHGRSDIAWVKDALEGHFSPFDPVTAIDLGSGLGRLSFPMAKVCSGTVYGVDISPGMRAEAERQAGSRGVANVRFVETLHDDVMVDWVNSYIVMQHILPRFGYKILENSLKHLSVGGHVSIQLTFAHDERNFEMLRRDINAWRFDGETLTTLESREHCTGEMSMYDYDMNRILLMFARYGVRDMLLSFTDHGGAYGFWVLGRKTV